MRSVDSATNRQRMSAVTHFFAAGALVLLTGLLGLSGPDAQANTTNAGSENTESESAEKPVPAERNPFAPVTEEHASADPLLGMIDGRETLSLNGDWRLIVDPMGVGNPGSFFGGFPRNKQAPTGMELVEYDFEQASVVRVPGDFNSQSERLFFYQGPVWYYRTFTTPQPNGSRQHLVFGGANFDATVWLNGDSVGRYTGGYVPFSFDISEQLRDGENTLIVRVDNRLSNDTVPTARTDWWPYGGLTRDVSIVSTPASYIRNVRVALLDAETRQVDVTIDVHGMPAGTPALVSIPQTGISAGGIIDEGGRARFTATLPLALWSPENPVLHELRFHAGEDSISDRIGLRTIETRGSRIFLNGQPIRLRGISTHEEPIGESGVAYSHAHMLRLLREAKALGANFVRAAHYPYSRHLARAADELGLLLWAEVPVYWNINWGNEATLEMARDMLARLIRRDWNRASVVIWSVANETPLSDARMTFLRTLVDDARELDSSRLISAALLGGGREMFADVLTHLAVRAQARTDIPPEAEQIFAALREQAGDALPSTDSLLTLTISDPLAEHTDVVAYNEYFGWYYSALFADQTGLPESLLRSMILDLLADMRITADVEKPIVISEFGAGAQWGRKDVNGTLWSEDYQAAVYAAQLLMLSASEQVQGISPWILKDFRAMLRPLAGVQDYYNRKGLMDEFGRRKLAFDTLREFYETDWGRLAPSISQGSSTVSSAPDDDSEEPVDTP
ncbi:MAG: beta galactosidase jelly roll domain-containing protein [Pseudomonadaceae bacterium]|nr:beta galactosidase jelly roll domain-containing protein [Pseudomonadaceae bacterium]